LKNFITGSEWM